MTKPSLVLFCMLLGLLTTQDLPTNQLETIDPAQDASQTDLETSKNRDDKPGVIPAHLEANNWADSVWHGPFRRSMDGKWQLTWDDTVNGQLDHEDKVCTLDLKDIDGRITGKFEGPVAGSVRDAILTGRFEGTDGTRVLKFSQREAGYVCCYQAIDAGGEILGVWHDTRNRSGDFRLLKYQ